MDIDKETDELILNLVNEKECNYAERFLKSIDMGDGRTALLHLVLKIYDERDYD